jgi:hypothetical protein
MSASKQGLAVDHQPYKEGHNAQRGYTPDPKNYEPTDFANAA